MVHALRQSVEFCCNDVRTRRAHESPRCKRRASGGCGLRGRKGKYRSVGENGVIEMLETEKRKGWTHNLRDNGGPPVSS
ncbi:hypothetical protein RRG08_035891 [Elysia crispata]|uniref:Uncharacterized protein n=1 Tax=Elysia crispata TaxID=231223 RepID=A0AAE1A1U9_9GAST|nr:hypothetical protein RRG08_035891 [Elysia crispata]